MTVFAQNAEASFVDVCALVTRITVSCRLAAIERHGMTPFTRREAVPADQGVFRVAVMVERDRLPTDFSMTLLALLAESGSMNVISLMTGVTVRRCPVLVELSFVAAFAFEFKMIPL